MSDEQTDAMPEKWNLRQFRLLIDLDDYNRWRRWAEGNRYADSGMAFRRLWQAAAPHMTGNGEAERLRNALYTIKAYGACTDPLIKEIAQVASAALRAAQPDAERTPLPCHHCRHYPADACCWCGERAPQKPPVKPGATAREVLQGDARPLTTDTLPSYLGTDAERAPQPLSAEALRAAHPHGIAARRAPQPEPRQDELEAVARALAVHSGWCYSPSFYRDWANVAIAALDAARRPPSEQNADGG